MARPNWFIRYRLYHLPFWLLYNYCWWVIQSGQVLQVARDAFYSPYAVKFFAYVLFQAVAVYVNLYFLVPKYLQKGKVVEYVAYLVLATVGASMCIVSGYYFTPVIAGRTYESLFGPQPFDFFKVWIGNPLPSTIAAVTLAMSVKLAKNWLQTQRRQQLLEKEKLETELNFLKYQINPHFLFNTINSIFFLIHKDPFQASESLARFSALLRYQLYECNGEQIQLGSEVAHLENFIGLEKLRRNRDLEVSADLPAVSDEALSVAPFVLMTFVENAFKHVSRHPDRPNWIRIRLRVVGRELDFSVANSSAGDGGDDLVRYGGIGLKNVQRRLDLIYPRQHDLDIEEGKDQFKVRLRLQLREPEAVPA